MSTFNAPSLVLTGSGIDPTGLSDSTAALQARLNAADGRSAFLPAGIYKISSGLYLSPKTSLTLDDGATVKASVVMGVMLTVGNTTVKWANRQVRGGTWDCNNVAATGVQFPYFFKIL